MFGLAFVLTYFLSFDAMITCFVPGVIAFGGSVIGMSICALRAPEKKNEQ